MEMVIDNGALGFPDGVGDIFETRLLEPLDALEGLHQCSGCRRPDPLDAVEFADDLSFRASQTVVGDAEAVGLVSKMLDYAQRRTLLVDIERKRVAGKIDLLKPLRDADKRHLSPDPHLVESLDRGRQLSLATVDDHHVGELLPFGHHTGVAAMEHLFH